MARYILQITETTLDGKINKESVDYYDDNYTTSDWEKLKKQILWDWRSNIGSKLDIKLLDTEDNEKIVDEKTLEIK